MAAIEGRPILYPQIPMCVDNLTDLDYIEKNMKSDPVVVYLTAMIAPEIFDEIRMQKSGTEEKFLNFLPHPSNPGFNVVLNVIKSTPECFISNVLLARNTNTPLAEETKVDITKKLVNAKNYHSQCEKEYEVVVQEILDTLELPKTELICSLPVLFFLYYVAHRIDDKDWGDIIYATILEAGSNEGMSEETLVTQLSEIEGGRYKFEDPIKLFEIWNGLSKAQSSPSPLPVAPDQSLPEKLVPTPPMGKPQCPSDEPFLARRKMPEIGSSTSPGLMPGGLHEVPGISPEIPMKSEQEAPLKENLPVAQEELISEAVEELISEAVKKHAEGIVRWATFYSNMAIKPPKWNELVDQVRSDPALADAVKKINAKAYSMLLGIRPTATADERVRGVKKREPSVGECIQGMQNVSISPCKEAISVISRGWLLDLPLVVVMHVCAPEIFDYMREMKAGPIKARPVHPLFAHLRTPPETFIARALEARYEGNKQEQYVLIQALKKSFDQTSFAPETKQIILNAFNTPPKKNTLCVPALLFQLHIALIVGDTDIINTLSNLILKCLNDPRVQPLTELYDEVLKRTHVFSEAETLSILEDFKGPHSIHYISSDGAHKTIRE